MEFTLTPWEVRGKVDYDRLIELFGVKPIDEEVLSLLRRALGEVPVYIRRRVFYSHRDLDTLLRAYLEGERFYLYTGRGPSGPMHIGHILPFIFTKYLQDRLGCMLLIQLTPDEKYVYHEEMRPAELLSYTIDNVRDIIALGFKHDNTYIIDDIRHIKYLYPLAISVARKVTFSTARAVFGFTGETNIGLIFYMAVQAAPAFLGFFIDDSYRYCLIPAAIDQDPYWRVTRDVAGKLGFPKPAQVHGKLLPSLKAEGKMSASEPESAIYLSDEPEAVRAKIYNAFTGGQPTAREQRQYGGNPSICTIFSYFAFLFEEDDWRLEERYHACRSGSILCGDCKDCLVERINRFLEEHRRRRERVDESVIERYMLDSKVELDDLVKRYEMLR